MKKVLGIAAVEQDEILPFGKQTFYFEDMVKHSSDIDLTAFFFSPLDWQGDQRELEGYVFKENQWQKTRTSFPKIIYDRSFAKKTEDKQKIEKFRTFLKKTEIPVLNPIGYADLLNNKIEFHEFLSQNGFPTLQASPVEYIKSEDFLAAIEKTPFYLKPIFGTGGLGIYILEKKGDHFVLNNHTNTQAENYPNVDDLLKRLSLVINFQEYFVQPMADVVYFNERPLDIRVIIQNYGKADYRVTGLGVRVGQQQSFVSNLNSGGSALPIEALSGYYELNFGKNIIEEVAVISETCLRCCNRLGETFGNFLEIGFDILLTKDQGPIILEGNSKPSRWIFNVLADYYKNDPEQSSKYKQLRAETVRVPLLFADKNYPVG